MLDGAAVGDTLAPVDDDAPFLGEAAIHNRQQIAIDPFCAQRLGRQSVRFATFMHGCDWDMELQVGKFISRFELGIRYEALPFAASTESDAVFTPAEVKLLPFEQQ